MNAISIVMNPDTARANGLAVLRSTCSCATVTEPTDGTWKAAAFTASSRRRD